MIESWRRHYNTKRPHASLGYKPPAPEVCARLCGLAGCATPTGSAGQAPRRTQTNDELTFTPDHPMGADQRRLRGDADIQENHSPMPMAACHIDVWRRFIEMISLHGVVRVEC